jgi:hypothetical protein
MVEARFLGEGELYEVSSGNLYCTVTGYGVDAGGVFDCRRLVGLVNYGYHIYWSRAGHFPVIIYIFFKICLIAGHYDVGSTKSQDKSTVSLTRIPFHSKNSCDSIRVKR